MSVAEAAAIDLADYRDDVAELIADFTANVSGALDAAASRAAKAVLIDSIAVAMGALTHPAAQAARRHAYRFSTPDGCLVWGSQRRAMPDTAALANGVLLRCYDYNDFFVGKRNSGHPSDIVAGVIAAAEWVDASGSDLLTATALGYEVVAAMFDAFSTAPGGWDYTNLVAIGGACAIARLLRLDAAQIREALAMTVVPHMATDEIESGDLNARGDLTMWKRFNGSDAIRNALQACLLAQSGVEGAVRPFVGQQGFINKLVNKSDESIPVLKQLLGPKRPLRRVTETAMKRWPVGSLAQSAIQAALAARAQCADLSRIAEVRVYSEEGAYQHLVAIRQAPYAPISRETADHAMPYIVAAAVLDGVITTESFAPSRVLEPARRRFVKDKVKAFPAPELGTNAGGKHRRYEAGYLSRVEIALDDGTVLRGEAKPFPGHPKNPFSDADFADKLKENMAPFAGAERTAALLKALLALESLTSVRALTPLLALPESAGVDSAKTE